ncbi:hypothetical protein GCM10023259_072940 [Thermocatellispora tengchongensis]
MRRVLWYGSTSANVACTFTPGFAFSNAAIVPSIASLSLATAESRIVDPDEAPVEPGGVTVLLHPASATPATRTQDAPSVSRFMISLLEER